MKRTPPTRESILRALEEVAAKHPGPAAENEKWDMFSGNGRPRCLLGHVLTAHGFKAKDFVYQADDELIRQPGFTKEDATIFGVLPVDFELLERIQMDNDTGIPWKEIYASIK